MINRGTYTRGFWLRPESWVGIIVVAALVGGTALLIVGLERSNTRFREVCDAAHGTTVFDGRQYQCIIPKGKT